MRYLESVSFRGKMEYNPWGLPSFIPTNSYLSEESKPLLIIRIKHKIVSNCYLAYFNICLFIKALDPWSIIR